MLIRDRSPHSSFAAHGTSHIRDERSASNRLGPTTPSRISRDRPLPVRTPSPSYYRQRRDDFVRRNPGKKVPEYYDQYGDKYLRKFSKLTSLSKFGLKWRDRTLKNLQDAIEAKRTHDPRAFARLERDHDAFKAFAYRTHANAYIKAGLFKLPFHDLAQIATTPEAKDLLGKEGIKQIFDVLERVRPGSAAKIISETEKTNGRNIRDTIDWVVKAFS